MGGGWGWGGVVPEKKRNVYIVRVSSFFPVPEKKEKSD